MTDFIEVEGLYTALAGAKVVALAGANVVAWDGSEVTYR
jgi:hypothetical protein